MHNYNMHSQLYEYYYMRNHSQGFSIQFISYIAHGVRARGVSICNPLSFIKWRLFASH